MARVSIGSHEAVYTVGIVLARLSLQTKAR
jgi:hypothetical protein